MVLIFTLSVIAEDQTEICYFMVSVGVMVLDSF